MSAIFARAAAEWQAMRAEFDLVLEAEIRAAERETCGNLLNKAGRAAGLDARDLFTGPRRRAERYASEELRDYWHRHPRLTLATYETQWVGR